MEEIKDAVVGGVKGILATMPVGSVVMSIAQEVQNGILESRGYLLKSMQIHFLVKKIWSG